MFTNIAQAARNSSQLQSAIYIGPAQL